MVGNIRQQASQLALQLRSASVLASAASFEGENQRIGGLACRSTPLSEDRNRSGLPQPCGQFDALRTGLVAPPFLEFTIKV